MKKLRWTIIWILIFILCQGCDLSCAENIEWTCNSCGYINTTKYCLQCGAKKPEGIVCPECGEVYPIDTEANFCGNCGTKLSKDVASSSDNTFSNVESSNKSIFGMWIIKNYVDEFKQPTASRYITNLLLLHGSFSNSATNNSNLTVKMLIDKDDISFMLYEYEKYQVKTYSSSGEKYSIAVLDSDGKRHRLKGTMYSDRIMVNSKGEDELLSILANEGKVVFSISDESRSADQYIFTIDDTTGFVQAYWELTGQEKDKGIDITKSKSTSESEDVLNKKLSIPLNTMLNCFGKTTANVNSRTGPGKEYNIIRELIKGETVYLIENALNEKNEEWTWILVDGTEGYAMTAFLELLPSEENAEKIAEMEPMPVYTASPEIVITE